MRLSSRVNGYNCDEGKRSGALNVFADRTDAEIVAQQKIEDLDRLAHAVLVRGGVGLVHGEGLRKRLRILHRHHQLQLVAEQGARELAAAIGADPEAIDRIPTVTAGTSIPSRSPPRRNRSTGPCRTRTPPRRADRFDIAATQLSLYQNEDGGWAHVNCDRIWLSDVPVNERPIEELQDGERAEERDLRAEGGR